MNTVASAETVEPSGTGVSGPSRDADERPLLEVRGLRTHFAQRDGEVRAVDGVDLTLGRHRTLCLVGESGCGKSVTARSVLGLVDPPGRVVGGQVLWRPDRPGGAGRTGSGRGRRDGGAAGQGEDRAGAAEVVDLAALDPRGEPMRRVRGREISMVFQEPMASLSPMHTIGDQLVEAIRLHLPVSRKEAWERGVAQLARVGIPRPEVRMRSYSFQLSGGMCQRAMIAIALACEPSLLIADEPTTALDVTTQARILDLLMELQEQLGMSILFITHDLGVVAEIAHEVAVMYLGRVVEHGDVDQVFHSPAHPYTRALLRSIPTFGLGPEHRLEAIGGMVPHPSRRPTGCSFHPRCEAAIAGTCEQVDPGVTQLADGQSVSCHLHDDAAPTAAQRPDQAKAATR